MEEPPALQFAIFGIGVFGGLLNLYTSVVAFKLFRRKRDVVHLLVLSMALSDFNATGVTIAAQAVTYTIGCAALAFWLCHLWYCTQAAGLMCSSLSLTMLNVDKLIYFKWPLHYKAVVTRKRAWVVIVICWTVVHACTALLWWAIFKDDENNGSAATGSVFLSIQIVPTILAVVSSGFVSVYLYFLTRRLRVSTLCHNQSKRQTPDFISNLRSLVFIFVTTAWTVLSLVPFRILMTFYVIDSEWFMELIWMSEAFKTLESCSFLLLVLSPAVNPVITMTIYELYRQTAIGHCRAVVCRRRSTPPTSQSSSRTTAPVCNPNNNDLRHYSDDGANEKMLPAREESL